jgi:hypothetical protein
MFYDSKCYVYRSRTPSGAAVYMNSIAYSMEWSIDVEFLIKIRKYFDDN